MQLWIIELGLDLVSEFSSLSDDALNGSLALKIDVLVWKPLGRGLEKGLQRQRHSFQ